MANQTEMLDAATKAILSKQGNPETCLELKDSPYAVERSEYWTAREKAQAALEAAGVQALLSEIAALKAELAKCQESHFHPDWPVLAATRDGLREAWANSKRRMDSTKSDGHAEGEQWLTALLR